MGVLVIVGHKSESLYSESGVLGKRLEDPRLSSLTKVNKESLDPYHREGS